MVREGLAFEESDYNKTLIA
jgi:hypothetical protein